MGNVYSETRVCRCRPPDDPTKNQKSRSKKSSKSNGINKLATETNYSCDDLRLRPCAKTGPSSSKNKEVLGNVQTGRARASGRRRSCSLMAVESFDSMLNDFKNISLRKGSNREREKSPKVADQRNSEAENSSDEELPKNVLYYGCVFSNEISIAIRSTVNHFYKVCFDEVNQFQRFILNCCKDADICDPFQYYKKPGKRVSDEELEYHITANFLGRKPYPSYQSLVQPFCDKSFRIHLIGIVFTERTLGVRVKLTSAQQLIFDEKDTDDKSIDDDDLRKTSSKLEKELESYDYLDKMHRKAKNPSCNYKSNEEGILLKKTGGIMPLAAPEYAVKSRAHITIGCAPNVRAKQTGDDLVDIIDLEQRANTNFQQDFKLRHGILRQFGRHATAYVFYPEMEMVVPGTFHAAFS